MTEEEAAALGWEGDELRAYMKGREQATARAAEIMSGPWTPPAETAAAPPPGPTEQRAAQLAEAFLAEDARTVAARRTLEAARAAEAVSVVEDRPGDAPSPHQVRQWALAQAMTDQPPVLRPGDDVRADYAFRMPDGTAHIAHNIPAPRPVEIIHPDEWDIHEARWQFRQRQAENELLARNYGLDTCIREGIVSESEARLLDPERIRPVPELPGVPR